MAKPLAWFSIFFPVVSAMVFAQPTQPLPAALFAQHSLTLVRAGGRLGLVLPKSLTYSSRWSGVRRLLAPHLTAVFDAGRAWGEQAMLDAGMVFQRDTDFHLKRPELKA